MPRQPRRFVLRDRTAAAHAMVESLVGTLVSLESYRRYVCGTWKFRAPVEAGLAAIAWPEGFGAWRPIMLADWLRQDLADLGLPDPEPPAPAPPPADMAGLLGLLYVLEGSALGAAVLLPRARALGLGAAFGARHLARQTGAAARNWQAFVALMEACGPLDLDATVRAAESGFAAAGDAFREAGALGR